MWLSRVLAVVLAADTPVALQGGEDAGVPFILEALGSRTTMAWFEVDRWGDEVGAGNAFAKAINEALGTPLLSLALPLGSQISALRGYREEIGPVTVAATMFDPRPSTFARLVGLGEAGFRVVLDLRGDLSALDVQATSECLVLTEQDLLVTFEEAASMLPRALGDPAVTEAWRRSGGRFTELMAAANEAAGLPGLRLPGAAGPLLPPAEARSVDVVQAVQALVRDGDLVSALELAVLQVPEMAEDLLRQAGPRFQAEGLLHRLHLLLSALPSAVARSERVLEWRLVAAVAAGDHQAVLEDVDAHLAGHVAPALRARRAGTLPKNEGFELAATAVEASRTPLTLWQFGRLHPNDELGIEALRESVRLAEDHGSPYDVARNAHGLASRLLHAGEYARAGSWARWALDVVDRQQIQDGNRRLHIVNQLAVSRIMTGDLVGLRRTLADASVLVEGTLPGLATMFRSTMAQLALAEGRFEDAIVHLRATYQGSERRHRARFGYQFVRALLEAGEATQAREVARDVTEVSAAGQAHERSLAALARGMVAAVDGDPSAVDDLMEAMLDGGLIAEQRMTAALYYLLASGGAAHNVPRELVPLLSALGPTGLGVLSGPASAFGRVWATLSAPRAPLSFRFLGGFACTLDGADVKLPPRLAEAALALTLHPDGLSRDELNEFLVPDGHAPFTSGGMRSLLTRLRQSLPVSDAPYRFTVPYGADVLRVDELLGSGQVREAVALVRGPLLPASDAPGVSEHRWELEERLRQAALMGGDPDVLFDLAQRLVDDLEFWQAAAAALAVGDPRLALARARVKRLEESYDAS